MRDSWTHLVVGAGSAGATVAARLSQNPSNRVLLLEAGPDYRSAETPATVSNPNNWQLRGAGTHTWPGLTAHVTRDQGLTPYEQGRGVGGSSAVNNTFALRALPSDIERWARSGLNSLEWDELLNLYRSSECDIDFAGEDCHGSNGPLAVSRPTDGDWGPVDSAFREAAIDIGYPWCADLNAPGVSGVGPVPMTVRDAKRVSTNDAYLEPARERANLVVLGDACVTQVLFDGKRATGVAASRHGAELLERSEKIILCAGAIHTPVLLCRSGVGPASVLRNIGIDPLTDLPVGRNLTEHPLLAALLPFSDAGAFGPGYEGRQGCFLLRTGSSGAGTDLNLVAFNVTPLPGLGTMFVALMGPTSRGNVRLLDRDNFSVSFDSLSTQADLEALGSGVELLRTLLATSPVTGVSPAPFDVTGRPFDPPSDRDELASWMRERCVPYFHAAGTCRMGDDDDSVVDGQFRVRGIDNLYVVDASVFPDATSANTNLTVIALAERAAAML